MTRGAWLAVLATAFLSVLNAQARAPFTGTVRDEDGKALANAEVTCVFVPDVAALGAADRVTAKTDGAGSFKSELVVGCPYIVWAIGPAGEQGLRSMVRPRPDAAGGKTMDLTADERRGPVRLRIAGAGAWLGDGPLSLRLFVAGACVLGPDRVIPGDGTVNLPPLPAAQFSVALLDGKAQAIEVRNCSVEKAAVTFTEPREVPVVARDGAGRARPGVQLVQQVRLPGPSPDRFGDGYPLRLPMSRVAGVTGADGKATVRFVGERGWLLGRLTGHEDCWSGWVSGLRMEDGQQAADEGPLAFTMRLCAPRTLRVKGLGADEKVEVSFTPLTAWLSGDAGSALQSYVAAAAADSVHAADGVPGSDPVVARVRLLDGSPVPRRIVGTSVGEGRLRDFDVAGLRRMSVTVVDGARRPVPCADLAVSECAATPCVRWQDRLVTDAAGRAELWLGATADWMVYANTGQACAVKVVQMADPAGPVELTLEPLAFMRLRIVDVARRPVSGASLRNTCGGHGVLRQQTEAMALDMIASAINGAAIDLLRSDGAGIIEVPFLQRDRVVTRFKVGAGRLQGGEWTLRPCDEVQEIVVR